MKALCGVVAVAMAVLWVNWILSATLTLVDPASGDRWLGFGLATIITAPVVYGGFRLLESHHRD